MAYWKKPGSKSSLFKRIEKKVYYDFTEATRLNLNYAEAHFMRGYTSYYVDQDSIPCYTEAIRVNPEYAEAYFERGKKYHDDKNFSAAILDYEMAMRLDPRIEANRLIEYARSKKKVGDLNIFKQ